MAEETKTDSKEKDSSAEEKKEEGKATAEKKPDEKSEEKKSEADGKESEKKSDESGEETEKTDDLPKQVEQKTETSPGTIEGLAKQIDLQIQKAEEDQFWVLRFNKRTLVLGVGLTIVLIGLGLVVLR